MNSLLLLISIFPLLQLDAEKAANYNHQNLSYYLSETLEKKEISSKADWKFRREDILKGTQLAMGQFRRPNQKLPFKIELLGVKTTSNITTQRIRFDVGDGSQLSAFLIYRTDIDKRKRHSALVALHPTGASGKELIAGNHPKKNRQYGNELAQRGYVVVCPDYPSFGEQSSYDFDCDRYASGTMKGIVNHVRCVDLLESLSYVDKHRIGVIGHSLGGHNAIFLAAFDQRIKAVVTSCGWTPFHDYYGGKIAGWTSSRYMPALKEKYNLDPDKVPFDFYELIASLAPRSFYSVSPTGDSNFDFRGVKKAQSKIEKIYSLHGAEKNCQIVYPDCAHDFPKMEREKAYRFLDQQLSHLPRQPHRAIANPNRNRVEASSPHWIAGISRQVITPKEKIWLSGYASRTQPATGKLHELWAKGLYLKSHSGTRALMITLDLIGIDRKMSNEVCEAISRKHGLNRSEIALATSHTHTGPVVGENLSAMYFLDGKSKNLARDYGEFLKEKILQVADDAIANGVESTLEQGMGTATFAVNRRNNPEANVPELRSQNRLKGPIDHELPVLVIKSKGQLKGILFGYACHATTLSSLQYSGDWPGFAQIEIEKKNPGVTALFWAGCGADQNPLPRRTVELAKSYGRQTADAVQKVLQSKLKPIPPELETQFQIVPLKYDSLPSKKRLEQDSKSTNKYVASRAKLLQAELSKKGKLSDTYPYPIQLWKIGPNVSFFILGGEVVVDYSIRLKSQSKDQVVWVAAYANDVMAYIPSRRVWIEGGYEGAGAMVYYGLPSKWSAKVEDQIFAAIEKMKSTTATAND